MNRINPRLGFAALAIVAGSVGMAQGTQTGTITGSVKSTAGKAIAGANVTLKTPQGERSTVTDPSGNFRFPLLNVGNVTIVVSANGYIGGSLAARVGIDKNTIADFNLKAVSDASATVVVVGSTDSIDTTDAKVVTNHSLEKINDLPINTRAIATIANLTPGTTQDNNGLSIRGGQSTQVNYLVDGADVMDPVTGGASVRLNEEMLEEVQVITGGAAAEYGRFTSGVVNTVTKTGTNEWKGVSRWDVTNPSWNAYNPLDRGRDGKTTFANHSGVIQQYQFSGPIIRDHLFFVVGYRTTSPKTSTPGTTTSADFGGVGFVTTRSEERKDIKIDWQISTSHKIFWQWNKTVSQRYNIDYPTAFGLASTSIDTLTSQADLFQYVTFGYQGQLRNDLILDVRVNNKKETLGASVGPSGGQGPKNAPMWIDLNTGDVFDNGFFSNDGDSRPIKTANASLTWFLDAAGSHKFKTGVQLFESSRNAANSQTPTNSIIFFDGFAAPGNSAISNRVLDVDSPGSTWLEEYTVFLEAKTKNRIDSVYLQDDWTLNKHWAFNLGLRYDKFKSTDDLGRQNFTFSDLAPRLAATFDVNGDGRWVVQGNYSVYIGQVIQGATDAASAAGNPITKDYVYLGGDPLVRSSFSNTPFFVDDSATPANRLTSIDPNLKSPRVIEWAAEVKHNDGAGAIWSVGVTKRKWDRFVDDYKAKDSAGTVRTVIKNDDTIQRDYFGLELGYQKRATENFSYGYTLTLSSLKGDYEGGQVGTTDQRNNFGNSPTAPTQAQLSPYGFLAGDQPVKFIGNASYSHAVGKGRMNVSSLAYYNGGGAYSLIGSNTPSGQAGFSSTYNRYFGDRGSQRFPDTYRVDMQVGYSVPVWNRLEFFTRLNVTNLFNHQILQSWNTSGTTVTGAWRGGSSFGRPTSSSNYILGRTLDIAAGIRF